MHTSASQSELGLDHGPGLMRLALRLAGSADAEDLVQSTWLRALEHEAPVKRRRAWLHRVLVNERNMSVRSRIRRDDREQTTPPPDAPVDVEQVVHSLEVARVVQNLVEDLDDDVRTVVRERYFDGHSAADIARRHAIPAGTVRWRLKRGLDTLRDQLDARYGGRRALWAGGLIPGALSPTLSTSTASSGATASGKTIAAAGKGLSAMTAKIIVAAAVLIAGTATTAAVMSSGPDAPEPTELDAKLASAAVARTPTQPESRTEPSRTEAPAEVAKKNHQADWDRLRTKIRAAHAAEDKPAVETHRKLKFEDCEGETCEQEVHVDSCTDPDCLSDLASQIMEMHEGCEEFMTDAPTDLALKAKVIGAPDIGSVVESVELESGDDVPEELQECLTQAMYTLDLEPAESNLEQEITLMLGHHTVDGGDNLDMDIDVDEETRAKIDAALEGHGEGTVRVLKVKQEIEAHEE